MMLSPALMSYGINWDCKTDMSLITKNPKIYHITHVDNLPAILKSSAIQSDSLMRELGNQQKNIGMSQIKKRRLKLPVQCYPLDKVGEYVPFYFCPRSVMLYIISRKNHEELSYEGGQEPILHLEADLNEVISWANKNQVRWAFTLSNAGAVYTSFHNKIEELNELNWAAINSNQWSDSKMKEAKQAEFLLQRSFPWKLIKRIGVNSKHYEFEVQKRLNSVDCAPTIVVKKDWYY